MDAIQISGGAQLVGEVEISGSKNAALPILCASLLADGTHTFTNVPALRDVHTTVLLLAKLGMDCEVELPEVRVHVQPTTAREAPYELVKQMRASILVLGPLVARYGEARVSLPGGCAIGARPIDQHLKGLERMGAEVRLEHGYVDVHVPGGRLRGSEIQLDMPTVTGTENLMCAAALADGVTHILGAACEPEVADLATALRAMGADIQGDGTPVITIRGVERLHAAKHAIIADRIEAGTYMVAAAVTRGNVLIRNATLAHVEPIVARLREAGAAVEVESKGLRVVGRAEYKPFSIATSPHPGFPTDMQAQFMVLACRASGRSVITETVFENRFMHVSELGRMGAQISTRGQTAWVQGPVELQGATVMATDLRASASLVLAGLIAQGKTTILRVYHLDRGYERLEHKLRALGATIERVAASG